MIRIFTADAGIAWSEYSLQMPG